MRHLLAVAFVAATAGQAIAQERPANDGWSLTVGAGGLLAPTYEGDDAYRLSILPNIQIAYGNTFFASVQDGVGYRVINTESLRAGPIARIKFSRDADGDQPFAVTGDDSADLAGLGDVDTSFELGGFVEYEIGGVTLSAEARQAVSGHKGFVADIGAKWSGRASLLGPPIIWSAGPRVRLVSEDFNDAYFGVDTGESLASGLPQYKAEGGVHSYGIGATAIVPISNAWTAVIFAGYDKLAADAGDSPLVQLRGSEDQATLGVFLSYTPF